MNNEILVSENQVPSIPKNPELQSEIKEFHHLVKNHFQFYFSLLNLQINTLDQPQSLIIMQSARNRFRQLALLYDITYQDQSIHTVNLSDYISDILSYLCRNLKNPHQDIQLKSTIHPISLSIQKALACGMIVNELISNCFQHAFPENTHGEVWMKCLEKDDQYIDLMIQDNGRGLPEEVDLDHSSSLGLKLVGLVSRQLGACMKIESRQSPLRYQIQFPKA